MVDHACVFVAGKKNIDIAGNQHDDRKKEISESEEKFFHKKNYTVIRGILRIKKKVRRLCSGPLFRGLYEKFGKLSLRWLNYHPSTLNLLKIRQGIFYNDRSDEI